MFRVLCGAQAAEFLPVQIGKAAEDGPAMGVGLLGRKIVVSHQLIPGVIDLPGVAALLVLRFHSLREVRLTAYNRETVDVVGKEGQVPILSHIFHPQPGHNAVPHEYLETGAKGLLSLISVIIVVLNQGIAAFFLQTVYQIVAVGRCYLGFCTADMNASGGMDFFRNSGQTDDRFLLRRFRVHFRVRSNMEIVQVDRTADRFVEFRQVKVRA